MIFNVARNMLTELPGTTDLSTRGRGLARTLHQSYSLASQSLRGGKDLSEEIFDFLLVRLKPVPSGL
jgi:hypothetical protein